MNILLSNLVVSENKGRGIIIYSHDQNNALGDGVTVRDSLISKNRSGGVYIRGYGHQILDSEISQNSGSSYTQSGINIYDHNTSRILVSNVNFQGNTNSYPYGSAGLFIGSPSENDAPISTDITIEKSKFLENRNSSNDHRSAGAIFIGRMKGVTDQ